MRTVTAEEAHRDLDRWLEEVARTEEPLRITGRRGSCVLVSEQAWRSMEESLALLSVPGTAASIRQGLATPIDDCADDPGW